MKTCSKCGELKDADSYYNSRRSRDGKNTQCKSCQNFATQRWKSENIEKFREYQREYRRQNPQIDKRTQLRRRYGITLEDYDLLLLAQGSLCALCGEALGNDRHLDHCHATGRIRGILHAKCNQMLGMASDDVEKLRKGAEYLLAHLSTHTEMREIA